MVFLDSRQIGTLFTLYGIITLLAQSFVFPPLALRYGPLVCLRASLLTLVVVALLTPFTSWFPSSFACQAALLMLLSVRGTAGAFAYPTSTILLTNSASSLRTLGTVNGFATSAAAIARAVGPGAGGGLFSAAAKRGVVGVPFLGTCHHIRGQLRRRTGRCRGRRIQ